MMTDAPGTRDCTEPVVFAPSQGGVVEVDRIDIGDGGTGNGADWLELTRMKVLSRVNVSSGARHIRLTGIDGGSFYIHGAQHVTLEGNDWGPCASDTGGGCQGLQNFIDADYGKAEGTSDITIDGDSFHDFTITPGSDSHFECLFVTGANGRVVIRNSRFVNCETYGIYFTGYLSNHGYSAADITVEGNLFGRTCCFGAQDRDSAINLGATEPVAVQNLLIRNNAFVPGQTVVREGGPTGSNIRIVANILGSAGNCVSEAVYQANIIAKACGTEDRRGIYGYRLDGPRLLPYPPEAEAVKQAFQLAGDGETISQIARVMRREHGASPPPGGWSFLAIRRLLADITYLGGTVGARGSQPALVGPRAFIAARATRAASRGQRR